MKRRSRCQECSRITWSAKGICKLCQSVDSDWPLEQSRYEQAKRDAYRERDIDEWARDRDEGWPHGD